MPDRGGDCFVCEFARVVGVEPALTGRSDIPNERDRRPEDADLLCRLVGADAARLVRAVRGEEDERHAGVVRLQHRGVEVCDRGAGCRHHQHRRTGFDRDPQGEKPGHPLIDTYPQPDEPGALELRCGERERLRPRSGAEDDIANTAPDELAEQGHRELTGRAFASHRFGSA